MFCLLNPQTNVFEPNPKTKLKIFSIMTLYLYLYFVLFLSARLASASASKDLYFLPCLSQNLAKHQFFSNIIQIYVIPCLQLTLKMSTISCLWKYKRNFEWWRNLGSISFFFLAFSIWWQVYHYTKFQRNGHFLQCG